MDARPVLIDRDLDDHRSIASGPRRDRKPLRDAGAFASPIGFLGSEAQDGRSARALLDVGQTECERICVCGVRELVNKGLGNKPVPVRIGCAPRPDGYSMLVIDVGRAKVRDRVRCIDHLEQVKRIDPVLHELGLPAPQPRRRNDLMGESDNLAAPDHAANGVDAHRTVEVVLNVVFAGPHDFDRSCNRLRHLDRFPNVVRFQTAAESAAQIRRMDRALFERKPAGLRRKGAGAQLHLRRRPDGAAAVADVGRSVHRLHCGVSKERTTIDGLDHGPGRNVRITARNRDALADPAAREMLGLSKQRGGAYRSIRPFVPDDVERTFSLECGPRVLGDDCDAV